MNTSAKSATAAPEAGAANNQLVERIPRPERIVVESGIPVLDTGKFDHMMRIAKLMASSSLVPEHLNAVRKAGGHEVAIEKDEAIANCFLVVNQAVRWNMDPFAVAQHIFITKGKIGYEGKLIAAVINTHPSIIERLSYRFEGEVGSPKRKVIVSARTSDLDQAKQIDGTVEQWRTKDKDGWKAAWTGNADQQLTYRGAREWARRHLPEAILGVYSEDELEQFTTTDNRVDGDLPTPPQRGAAGLAAALGAGVAQADDATIIDGARADQPATPRDAQPEAGEPAASGKPVGTLEQRDVFVKAFQTCADTEILALKRDEVNLYDFTAADLAVINEAYDKRLKELEG